MIEPQLNSTIDLVSKGQKHAEGETLRKFSNIHVERWESKLFEAGLASSDNREPKGTPGCPEVLGFECIGRLGSGASGEVWLADELESGRAVAIKIMHRRTACGVSDDLFHREFRLLAKMHHPNLVVPSREILTSDGRRGITMEWIDGLPLDEWLENRTDLPLDSAVHLFSGIVSGVAYLHDHGMIHRDIKPANVLVDSDGLPRIIDFGLARLHHDGVGNSVGVAGTLHFMAPEQASDGDGARAMPVDVYALGLIFHRILLGCWLRPPDATPSETLAQVLHPPPLRLPKSAKRIPADLIAILRHSLATDSSQRYRHARDLEADLARYFEKMPVLARRHTVVYLTSTLLRRQARRSAVAAALVLAGLTAGGVIHHRHRAVALENEGNLRHAYSLASFTLAQLRKELGNGNSQDAPAPIQAREFPPPAENPLIPVNQSGKLDLRFFQAQLAELRSASLEGLGRHGPALSSIESALDLYSGLSIEQPDDPLRLLDAARARLGFARLLSRIGRAEAAGSESRKVLRQISRLEEYPQLDPSEWQTLRWDATRICARHCYHSGDRAKAFRMVRDLIMEHRKSPVILQACPEDGLSPRLAMAADDLATYAMNGNPATVSEAAGVVSELTGIMRARHEGNPQSYSLACGLARCLHAAARLNLRKGNHQELHDGFREAASLLIHYPADSKHLALGLIWEMSRTAIEWVEMAMAAPDPATPKSAITVTLRFTGHLRRNGFDKSCVLAQRARIFWFESRLACRIGNRQEAAKKINRAMEILRYRHFVKEVCTPTDLLTAQVMRHAEHLSDLPETGWSEAAEKELRKLLGSLEAIKDRLTPEQNRTLAQIQDDSRPPIHHPRPLDSP